MCKHLITILLSPIIFVSFGIWATACAFTFLYREMYIVIWKKEPYKMPKWTE